MNTIKPKGRPVIHTKSCDIYLLDDQHVLKLFHDNTTLEDMQKQIIITNAVRELGLPVPRVQMNVVEHADNGRSGIVLERIYGETLIDLYIRHPINVHQYARLFTSLHEKINRKQVSEGFPLQRKIIKRKIQHADDFSMETRLELIGMLKKLPDGDSVCHGDLHPGNIMIAEGGPVVIDWIDATRGNPLCDIARSMILLNPRSGNETFLFKVFQKLNHYFCRKEYSQSDVWNNAEFKDWLIINAAIRVKENIPVLEKRMLYKLVMRSLPVSP